MKLKTGDKVVVIAGKSKGKEGTIISVLKDENKVVVEGANMVKNILNQMGNNQDQSLKKKHLFTLQM